MFHGLFGPLHLSDKTCDSMLPDEPYSSWKWICENVHTHKGAPFNYIDFPWVEGICDAWDSPFTRLITFMAGSRLGKTETFLSLILCAQHHRPDIGMLAGSTESLIFRTIGDRYYGMLDKTPACQDYRPPEHRRNKRVCRTKSYINYGAWSGSPTTLGDLDPKYKIGLELDKWSKSSSEEADPAELFQERGAEIPDGKTAMESTPTIEGLSRIKKYVKMGTDRKFYVPCPRCSQYQPLRRNSSGDPNDGGLWWDREKNGSTTSSRAAETARYICEICRQEWGEEERRPAIRRGRWVAPGEEINSDGIISGRPINAGPHESFSLSRMYGPTFSFGDYARAYVKSIGEPEFERSFANNWDGDTWVPIKVDMTWDTLAEKLCVGEWELNTIPKQCQFITTSVDVQIDHFVLTTWAWDRNQVAHLVAYGTVATWDLVKRWLGTAYRHLDGGDPMISYMNLIDSRDGNRKDEIVEFCRSVNRESGPWVWPSMGARPGSMNMQLFRKLNIDADRNIGQKANVATKIEGLFVVMVNTTFSQEWLDNALARRQPGDPMSVVLPRSMRHDKDFFEQVLNESYDRDSGLWVRVDKSTIPVDFRDCCRYARVAAEVYCNGNWARVPAERPVIIASNRDTRRASTESTETQSRFVRTNRTWIRGSSRGK